jgi:ATP-dependent RNA helicase SUPV3L1/SUV3
MIETEPNSIKEYPPGGWNRLSHGLPAVCGFQVIGAEPPLVGQNASTGEVWREAVRVELETRAVRFHQAVDAAIVLSNDGIIRWLGDPVAKLAPGPNALTPRALILMDETLSPASRDIVKTRIDLWLMALTRRLLGPLFALEATQAESVIVRDLAGKLSRSLGILERRPIRKQIKAIAQSDRAELRKYGARFGAYYIFLPALLKPAPRSLAVQLWSLQAPDDSGALMRTLGPLASSGRTSLPLDKEISREAYCAAGYRPCGERIVRVDVVERLASIIRAAMVERPTKVPEARSAQRPSSEFIVNGQMTSLAGCSGEQFNSILRSMRFQSVQLSKSDFFGSPATMELREEGEGATLAESSRPMSHFQAALSVTRGGDLSVEPVQGSQTIPPVHIRADESCSDNSRASIGRSSTSAESVTNEVIVVWRTETRAFSPPSNRSGPAPAERLELGTSCPSRNVSRKPTSTFKRRHHKNQRSESTSASAADARNVGAGAPFQADRAHYLASEETHRQTANNRDMPPSVLTPRQHPRAEFDPNSPFAKLIELRSLLEGQAHNGR